MFDTVASIAADPEMPPLDIMVVGDHNTPMWSRAAVRHFRPGLTLGVVLRVQNRSLPLRLALSV